MIHKAARCTLGQVLDHARFVPSDVGSLLTGAHYVTSVTAHEDVPEGPAPMNYAQILPVRAEHGASRGGYATVISTGDSHISSTNQGLPFHNHTQAILFRSYMCSVDAVACTIARLQSDFCELHSSGRAIQSLRNRHA